MDKIEKIRKRIEALLNDWKYGSSIEAKYRCEVYKELLEDIDALQEESVSEDLEEAAHEYADLRQSNYETAFYAFMSGAKWQKAKDQETIELAEDHVMLAGMEKMKEQMMKDAVGGYVIEEQKVKVIVIKDE